MLKLKKISLLILVYFLFYLFLEIFACGYLYFSSPDGVKEDVKKYGGVRFLLNIQDFKDENYEGYIHKPVLVKNSKKPAIAIFGCSFGYGGDKNLLANDLSKLTNRSVYNYSVQGVGPQMMYYAIEKGKVADNIDTYIYVYICDHELRSCKFRCTPLLPYVVPKYKLGKNNKLKIEYPNFFQRHSFIYREFESVFPLYYKNGKYANEVFRNVVLQSYSQLKKKNNNMKFIILNYSDFLTEDFPCVNEFNNAGIEVISVNDLTSQNMFQEKYYIAPSDTHPNAVAWDMVSRKLVEKCDL